MFYPFMTNVAILLSTNFEFSGIRSHPLDIIRDKSVDVNTSSSTRTKYLIDENAAKRFLKRYNQQILPLQNKATVASWNFATNLTEANGIIADKIQLQVCIGYN